MDIFSYVVAGLESKEFGNEKFYFDEHGAVIAIKHGENISYAVYDSTEDCVFFVTETNDDRGNISTPIDMRKFFIVPEINKRNDVEFLCQCSIPSGYEYLNQRPKSTFLVVNYGIIENPMFKGCKFSNSLIDVVVQNCHGKTYSISFKVGDGICGCDKILDGNIPNAYTMNLMGEVTKNGTLVIWV